jgi:methanogenic corrinoid protein MtbC1
VFEALVEGRVEDVSAMLVNAYLHGHTLASLFDEVLSRAMHRVGELWYEGKLSVAQEHVATRTALSAIQRLRGVIDVAEENGLLAICCGGEDDFHELSVQCTKVLLESEGWRVTNLGPNTPFFALAEATEWSTPQLVCVSATILHNLDRAVREYSEFRDVARGKGTAIVLGGAGLSDDSIRKRFPAELHADTFVHLLVFATTLASEAQAARADIT